ncbi:hypothetical protein NIES37_73260 (plasmid) [Tolypothrix tenuis PCC 7101]|uniref:Uncharacterized protein n=1 Tax=Tolypothrix tenuis PCC 7101 TaxID=231146 RepID=A0A1Z4NC53_9CYAN|nr:hypothetical protein [Aulosira sp. FACHB-113]BAZ03313.1 hypothetical protein NIES37_73260 [Tolypothrix tenuis PCC 7101]BAZ78716.1 hypothetical protein NIES50_73490 [Aulosira laxa NIES-50]
MKTQNSEQPQTQLPKKTDIQPSGYPNIQLPEQPDTHTDSWTFIQPTIHLYENPEF